jgi:hypothetical protein
MKQNICHGFYEENITINNESININSLKYDLHIGENQSWYADPNYNKTFVTMNKQVNIKRTFRHKDCEILFFSLCSLIHTFSDFRKRALRAHTAIIPKGKRLLESRVNFRYLKKKNFFILKKLERIGYKNLVI